MFREFVAALRRRKQDVERDLSLAWHIELLHRQKKLPDLKKWLPSKPEQKQSTKHHKVMLEMIGAKSGIRMRKTRLIPASKHPKKKGTQ